MSRVIYCIIACISALASLGVTASAYTVLQLDVPPSMPVWLWNLNFTIMLLVGLAGVIYCTFWTLDELFYAADSRQRITGRRTVPTKARPVTVTWRDR